jgi:hypothetical protein
MRNRLYAIWSILLVLVVSIAVFVPSCDGGADLGYELDVAENPAEGGTATDLTGASSYLEGDEATIQAVAASCYRFVNWSAPTGEFDDPNAATTNFTMPAQDVTVTANFELKPVDHYRIYEVDYGTAPYIGEEVELEDQFGAFNKTVGEAWWFGNPVDKTYKDELTPMSDENNHLAFYTFTDEEPYVLQSVEVTNQFGTHNLSVVGPLWLAVPTQKLVPGDHDKWDCVDHFSVYLVINEVVIEDVYVELLEDQFGPEQGVDVWEAAYLAVPVKKTCGSETTDIENPNLENHLVIYWTGTKEYSGAVVVSNQFLDGEDQTLDLEGSELLAVPSQKIAPPVPPLDHFKCYPTGGPPLVEMYVDLEDQFDDYWDAEVLSPVLFCNPVKKNTEPIVNEDNHLTFYAIEDVPQQMWDVVVNNQFGDGQTLTVQGPVALATPTQKHFPGDHGMPTYIDHYLLYTVMPGPSVAATVNLEDQFGIASDVSVTTPAYFANPCLKGYVDNWAPWNRDEHLLFYHISSTNYFPTVVVSNQFQQQMELLLDNVPQLLAVPSEKVSYKLFEE